MVVLHSTGNELACSIKPRSRLRRWENGCSGKYPSQNVFWTLQVAPRKVNLPDPTLREMLLRAID